MSSLHDRVKNRVAQRLGANAQGRAEATFRDIVSMTVLVMCEEFDSYTKQAEDRIAALERDVKSAKVASLDWFGDKD